MKHGRWHTYHCVNSDCYWDSFRDNMRIKMSPPLTPSRFNHWMGHSIFTIRLKKRWYNSWFRLSVSGENLVARSRWIVVRTWRWRTIKSWNCVSLRLGPVLRLSLNRKDIKRKGRTRMRRSKKPWVKMWGKTVEGGVNWLCLVHCLPFLCRLRTVRERTHECVNEK